MNARPQSHEDGAIRPIVEGTNLWVKKQRLLRGSDFREAFLLAVSAVAVTTLSIDKWASVTDRINLIERGDHSARFGRFRKRVVAFYGPRVDDDFVRNLWHGYRAAHHRRRLHTVAEKLCRDYRPTIQFEGREHIDRAAAEGNGMILWYDNFRHHPLIGKRPIAEAGYRALHLSSSGHGFSSSVLGSRFLNPIQTSAEKAYIARRVGFEGSTAISATREIKDHLAQNGVALITNNAYIARKVLYVPIGASAWIRVATTPLSLSWRTKAHLLPVTAIENLPFHDYTVTVGASLTLDGDDRNAAFTNAVRRYTDHLEPIVRAHPEQWAMWMGPIDQPPSISDGAG